MSSGRLGIALRFSRDRFLWHGTEYGGWLAFALCSIGIASLWALPGISKFRGFESLCKREFSVALKMEQNGQNVPFLGPSPSIMNQEIMYQLRYNYTKPQAVRVILAHLYIKLLHWLSWNSTTVYLYCHMPTMCDQLMPIVVCLNSSCSLWEC